MPRSEPPELEEFGQCEGDWYDYEDHLRRIFDREIVRGNLRFRGKPVKCRDQQFQHCITKGPEELGREFDLCRAKRIRWLPWVIRNADKHPEIDCSKDESTKRVSLLFRNEYKVVLAKTSEGFSVVTAFCVK